MSAMLTPEDVAEEMQVSQRTVYEWLRNGDLPGAKLGSAWRIDPIDVANFFDRHRAEQLMDRVKAEFPEVDWIEGRCSECKRPMPVPREMQFGQSGWVCGKACMEGFRHKLSHLIDLNSEDGAQTAMPEVVPYW